MRKLSQIKLLSIFFIFSSLSEAIVLDWSGSFQIEAMQIQSAQFKKLDPAKFLYNLHLKPDIKAFDAVRVRSWFLIAPQIDIPVQEPYLGRDFILQHTTLSEETNQPWIPLLSVRELFLEISHDFGLLQVGFKPYHFGLGMFYNDSSEFFSPFYTPNKGSLSWKGFIGSSYYIKPILHYEGSGFLNAFLEGGFNKEDYGISGVYKLNPLNLSQQNTNIKKNYSYLGAYAYYKKDSWSVKLEGSRLASSSEEVYGGFLNFHWNNPVQWLKLALNLGLSTESGDSQFFFDPSFSHRLSFLHTMYNWRKNPYSPYSFYSAFLLAVKAKFSFSDSLKLKAKLSSHLSYTDFNPLLYHGELTLKYLLKEGLKWKTSVGLLFPQNENNFYIGVSSRVAISF